MSLLDDVRLVTRTTSTDMDVELAALIFAALMDMRRAGVKVERLDPDAPSPLAKQAVFLWVKAHYGYDNSESNKFKDSYQEVVASLLNSDANECADDDRADDYDEYAALLENAEWA